MSTPIQITGNLTRDPELTFTPSGRAVARFDVAVNSRRKNAAGDWEDGEPTFYPCSAWGELGEHLAESLEKGARVLVFGRMRSRSWTVPEGHARAGETLTRMEVTADEVGASLRWATAAVTKAGRSGGNPWAEAPVAGADGYDEEPPF